MISSDSYARLELISAQSSEPLLYPPQHLAKQKLFVNLTRNVWRSLSTFVSGFVIGNSEPQIRRRCDRHGNSYFVVYDPASQQSQTLSTEREVRTWLEQRYYQ